MILREQRKRAESSKVLEERRIEELLKAKLEIAEKEKVFELKECQREQHRENIRKSFTKRVQSISQKNYSKKQEQEFNLEQINKHIRNYRKNQIQRYRESEILSKSRLDSDFSKIKSHLEFELRKSKQLN